MAIQTKASRRSHVLQCIVMSFLVCAVCVVRQTVAEDRSLASVDSAATSGQVGRRHLQDTFVNAIPDPSSSQPTPAEENNTKGRLSVNTVISACVAGAVMFAVSVGSMLWATAAGPYRAPPEQDYHASTNYRTSAAMSSSNGDAGEYSTTAGEG
jgi:hypothetical protein